MGFHRRLQPQALDRAAVTEAVTRTLAEDAAFAERTADPFLLDDPCELNSTGHAVIASCRDLVCGHCGKVF